MAFLDRLDSAPTNDGPSPSSLPPATPEQEEIFRLAETTPDNLCISAYAGAAKTSTMVRLMNRPAMSRIPTLCLAFNKKIADEMKARLPSNCTAMTLNSLGHRAWGKAISMRLTVDTKKNFELLKARLDKIKSRDKRDEISEDFSDILRTIAYGKSQGWVPDSCTKRNARLLDDADFFGSLDEDFGEEIESILIDCMNESIDQSFRGQIDFDDQIFMPVCFHAKFEGFPLTIVDEAQDLSSLNHQMLDLLVAGARLIAVGDPCQAIYAFRGAYGDSMDRLRERFHMREASLSTSFRCPKAVVREAHWRAPAMTYPDWAKEGEVTSLKEWAADTLPQNAVILCRNNAPLFRMAIWLLIEGRFPQLVGNDIGKNLLKTMSKLGPPELPQEGALKAFEDYKMKRLSRTRDHAKASVEDFCLCLRIFLERGETLGASRAYAEHLMNSVGPVKLMTGHKSKGLEFPWVAILDKQLLRLDRDGGKNQDRNLLYVMQTRAQESLVYLTTETFVSTEGTPE